MEIIKLLYVMTAHALTSWALREIDPLHPDVPKLVLRQRQLDDRAKRLFSRSAYV